MELVGFRENLGLLTENFEGRGSLTVDEFAGFIGVNHKTVRKAINDNKLGAIRVAGRIMIPVVNAARFMCGRK